MLEGHRLSVGVLRASLALKSQAGALSNSQPPTYLSTISRHEDQRRSREGPYETDQEVIAHAKKNLGGSDVEILGRAARRDPDRAIKK
jgi:hypothetical protein